MIRYFEKKIVDMRDSLYQVDGTECFNLTVNEFHDLAGIVSSMILLTPICVAILILLRIIIYSTIEIRQIFNTSNCSYKYFGSFPQMHPVIVTLLLRLWMCPH